MAHDLNLCTTTIMLIVCKYMDQLVLPNIRQLNNNNNNNKLTGWLIAIFALATSNKFHLNNRFMQMFMVFCFIHSLHLQWVSFLFFHFFSSLHYKLICFTFNHKSNEKLIVSQLSMWTRRKAFLPILTYQPEKKIFSMHQCTFDSKHTFMCWMSCHTLRAYLIFWLQSQFIFYLHMGHGLSGWCFRQFAFLVVLLILELVMKVYS